MKLLFSQDDADSLTREYLKHREQQQGETLPNGCLKVHLYYQTVQLCVGNKPNFMLHLLVFQDFLSTANGVSG